MIGISIVGIFLAVVHFKNIKKVAVAAPSTPSESGKLKMTNSNYKLTKKILIKLTNVACSLSNWMELRTYASIRLPIHDLATIA